MQEVLRKASTPLVALLLAATLFAAYQVGNVAEANHQPADKPFAAASKTQRFAPGTNVTLLTATVRNSKPTDMILQVSMECSILTDNVIMGGSNVPSESATTRGAVRAWIEIDGQTVPIISSSSPPQNPGSTPPNDEGSKVTFCNRVFERTVQDRESNDGIDYSKDYIATKSSNSFNWVRLNMGSGVHTIVLKADLTEFATPGSTADAYVGSRSMIGIPGKFSNDATINETGTG